MSTIYVRLADKTKTEKVVDEIAAVVKKHGGGEVSHQLKKEIGAKATRRRASSQDGD